jgi:hypothetical protein
MISPARVKSVCTLFFRTKALILRAEELDNNSGTFLQPTQELKAALDHVMRALSREYGLTTNGAESSDEYIDRQLDKAMGHIYRAYFDTADWMSINFREQVGKHLEPYDHTDIAAVLPSYFKEISPRFADYARDIAMLRNEKDIATDGDELFNRYEALLERLGEDVRLIVRMIPALQEYSEKRRRTDRRLFGRDMIGHGAKHAITLAIGALLAWLAMKIRR